MKAGVIFFGAILAIGGIGLLYYSETTYDAEFEKITQKYFDIGYEKGLRGDFSGLDELVKAEMQEKQDLEEKYNAYKYIGIGLIVVGGIFTLAGFAVVDDNHRARVNDFGSSEGSHPQEREEHYVDALLKQQMVTYSCPDCKKQFSSSEPPASCPFCDYHFK